ncbi:MAG: BrnA antitoxin family protein [Candidatus Omnitrophica bacterium]|nr:BrnA antitoxin family protein [Candidatus Omnitrophota bacterium]
MKKIPRFKSEEEERRFWETHEIVPYESSLKKVRMAFPKPRKRLISLRLDEEQLVRLKELASKKGIGYQTMIRIWIQERLDELAKSA